MFISKLCPFVHKRLLFFDAVKVPTLFIRILLVSAASWVDVPLLSCRKAIVSVLEFSLGLICFVVLWLKQYSPC